MFPACQALCLNTFLALSARHNHPMRWVLFSPIFQVGNWASTRLFLAQLHTAKSGKAGLSIWVLNIKLSFFSLISHCLASLLPLKVLSPPPKPGHLCSGIKICIRDHNDEDILTTAKSPFLSMNRINTKLVQNGVQLNRKRKKKGKKTLSFKFLIQSIYCSKLHNLSPCFLKCKKEGCYQLHSIATWGWKWNNIYK